MTEDMEIAIRQWAVQLAVKSAISASAGGAHVTPEDIERWASRFSNFAMRGAFSQ